MNKLYSLRSFLVIVFLLISSIAVTAQTVYITKTGTKYHSDGCQYLRKSQITTTLQKALNAGYDACSRCNPPISGNVIPEPVKTNTQSEQQYSSRCAATTKKGTQCKRNAANGSSYCWQHQ